MDRRLSSALDWIRKQQDVLDEILAATGRSYLDKLLRRPNGLYDLEVANRESFRLSRGKDLCYDRPGIGLAYGLWYHARRVNTSLGLILPSLLEAEGKEVQIYDLGAGTGAFLWAVSLGCQSMNAQGLTAPRVRIINVDTSPFMLHYLEQLWDTFSSQYDTEVEVECRLNTWSRERRPLPHAWLCASYLFDHEDKKEDLTRDFDGLIEDLQPDRVFLSTSSNKMAFMDSIAERLKSRGYVRGADHNQHTFRGLLTNVNDLRSEIKATHRIHAFESRAAWDERSFTGYTFHERQASLGLDAGVHGPDHLDLFLPHIEDRRRVKLSEEQAKAATPDGYPTVIFGPAGCGKSIVITERVKNLVENHDYSTDLRILVTTFNKYLQEKVLRPWLEELLDDDRFHSKPQRDSLGETCRDFFFDDSPAPNIRLMHFDVLPTRLAKVHRWKKAHSICKESDVSELCRKAVEKVTAELLDKGEEIDQLAHVLDPEYVEEEFYRVYYGGLNFREDRYLTCARPGRPILHRDKRPRQVLWRCLEAFNDECQKAEMHTFTHRRLALYQYLDRSNEDIAFVGRQWHVPSIDRFDKYLSDKHLSDKHLLFTHLFVDEVQDCTNTDFGIFYRLLEDPNELVVGGDLAQAVHLGRTAFSNVPRLKGLNRQKRRKFIELQGSYRLPFRISEALVPLSARIQNKRRCCKDRVGAKLQSPYRGSPPGARPVFVWANSTEAMAEKVRAIVNAYGEDLGGVGFDIGRCSILEKDVLLRKALTDSGIDAETNTILRLKGTEKTCVLWSTRRPTETREEAEEYAYTILTRCSRLLIVALFPNTCSEFKPIIRTFERERIIVWDDKTERRLASCMSEAAFSDEYEEHEDPVWEDRP